MGIVLREEKGSTCPVAVCDSCGETIKNYGAGWVVWSDRTSEHTPIVLCKTNRCVSKTQYIDYPSMELRDFLINLCRNAGMKTEKDFHEAIEFVELSDRV